MTVEPPDPPAEDLDWGAVVAWLPRFTAAGFIAGQWGGGEQHAPGERPVPGVEYADDVVGFVRHLYDLRVVAGFDWPTWVTERGTQLWEDPQRLAEASLEECRMLLAAHVRADRFTEGHLLQTFTSGHTVAVLERVDSLIDTHGT